MPQRSFASSLWFCNGARRLGSQDSLGSSDSGTSSSSVSEVPQDYPCAVCPLGTASSSEDSDDSQCCSLTGCGPAKFHFVPRNGWHPFLRRMHCSARNTLAWKGEGPIPEAPEDCWMLPTSDEMALLIAQLQSQLLLAGWKLLTCAPATVERLSNKASLQQHARQIGMHGALPVQYSSPETADYPCILKAALGQHGKDVHIVDSKAEAYDITHSGFGSDWVLQELISGCMEYSVSLLVDRGEILDAICTEYEYDKEEYVWPYDVEEVRRSSHSNVPKEHLAVMGQFLREYSGICNFNYKMRESGSMCIFEVNTRVGADLACDVPRPRARELFEKLDQLPPRPAGPEPTLSVDKAAAAVRRA